MKGTILLFVGVVLLTAAVIGREWMEQSKQQWCCYYDQHYHNCYSGKAGCVLGPAIEFSGGDPGATTLLVYCSAKLECPAQLSAGYFMRGFRQGCPECATTKIKS